MGSQQLNNQVFLQGLPSAHCQCFSASQLTPFQGNAALKWCNSCAADARIFVQPGPSFINCLVFGNGTSDSDHQPLLLLWNSHRLVLLSTSEQAQSCKRSTWVWIIVIYGFYRLLLQLFINVRDLHCNASCPHTCCCQQLSCFKRCSLQKRNSCKMISTMMMIPAAAELLGMGNQGLPDFYFSKETSLESFGTWESWGTQVKFEFYMQLLHILQAISHY